MTCYGEALAEARASLKSAGVVSAALDARLLLADASGLEMAALIARNGDPMPGVAQAAFRSHIGRRLAGEPVARILGEKDFWGLPIKVSAATLVPRPDTETLVEVVLSAIPSCFGEDITIADLGTGSGAILIALLKELPSARGAATDISDEALQMARLNARRLGVADRASFKRIDFADGPPGPFHVVVANPPYIESDAIDDLETEIREHDPRRALDGGPDGLAAYRAIVGRIDSLLVADGLLAVEVGFNQGGAVAELCAEAGLDDIRVHPDLAARERVVSAIKTIPADGSKKPKKALGKVWRSG